MSIVKNYIYNLVYQVLIILFPIITIPYVTRVLGSENLGIFAFTDSIIQYFALAGTIGVGLYASRQIAYSRDNIDDRSKVFWEIFSMKTLTVAISLLVFYTAIYLTDLPYRNMYLIQSINIVALIFDAAWLFTALEDFKKILMRNLIVRGLGYAGLFIFIKDKNDLFLYALLIAVTNILGNIALLFHLPKHIKRFKFEYLRNSFIHFLPCLALFIPQIALQIYTILDKTMVGIFSSPSEVAFYDVSQKLARIALAIVTSASLILLPRISNYFSKGDTAKIKEYVDKSFKFAVYLSLPIMFGMLGISDRLIPWFLGPEFSKVSTLMIVTSAIIPLVAANSVFGIQLMLPVNKVKEYTTSVIIGAVLNFVLNLLLIPKIHSLGACISSLIAEAVVAGYQYYHIKYYLPLKVMFEEVWKYLLSSIFLFIIVKLIGYRMEANIITTLTQTVIGMLIYFGTQYLLRSKMQSLLVSRVIQVIKSRYFNDDKILNELN